MMNIRRLILKWLFKPEPISIKFVQLDPTAMLPCKRAGDAGYDLFSCEETTIPPRSIKKISTGLQLADMPLEDWMGNSVYIQFFSRSGLASKSKHMVANIIDSVFRSTLCVLFHNDSDEPYQVTVGDKIAQMIVLKCASNTTNSPVDISWGTEITSTERAAGGFGSTDLISKQ